MSIDYSKYRKTHKKRPLSHRIKKKIVGSFYNRENKPYIQSAIGGSQIVSLAVITGHYKNEAAKVADLYREHDKVNYKHVGSRATKKGFYYKRKLNDFSQITKPKNYNIQRSLFDLGDVPKVQKKISKVEDVQSLLFNIKKVAKTNRLGVYGAKIKNKKKILEFTEKVVNTWKKLNPYTYAGNQYSKGRIILNKRILKKSVANLSKKSSLALGVLAGTTYLHTLLLKKHKRRNRKYSLKEFRAGVHETNKGVYNTERFKNELNSLDIIALKKVVDDNRRLRGKKL